MKKQVYLILFGVLMVASGCVYPGSCVDPTPLQPSFTQDKYIITSGESVTFTYNGPEQPVGVEFKWVITSETGYVERREGAVISHMFIITGPYKVELWAQNCNASPSISVNPALVVNP